MGWRLLRTGKTFYVDDSEQRNIRVYKFLANGTITDGRIFGEEKGAAADGVPDGIRIDEQGNLFVTGPKGIWDLECQGRSPGHHRVTRTAREYVMGR